MPQRVPRVQGAAEQGGARLHGGQGGAPTREQGGHLLLDDAEWRARLCLAAHRLRRHGGDQVGGQVCAPPAPQSPLSERAPRVLPPAAKLPLTRIRAPTSSLWSDGGCHSVRVCRSFWLWSQDSPMNRGGADAIRYQEALEAELLTNPSC
eukprot:864607-Prymnesium_polylepis.1